MDDFFDSFGTLTSDKNAPVKRAAVGFMAGVLLETLLKPRWSYYVDTNNDMVMRDWKVVARNDPNATYWPPFVSGLVGGFIGGVLV